MIQDSLPGGTGILHSKALVADIRTNCAFDDFSYKMSHRSNTIGTVTPASFCMQ